MKKTITILLALTIVYNLTAQEKDTSVEKQFFILQKTIDDLKKEMTELREKVYEIELRTSPNQIKQQVLRTLNLPEYTHTVMLKNGSIVKGKLVKESMDEVIIQTGVGYLKILKKDIDHISDINYKEAKLVFFGPIEEKVFENRIEYEGRIKNTGLRRADFPRVIIEVYDEKAKLIASDTTYVEGNHFIYKTGVETDCTIEPEQVLPFKCVVYIPEGRKPSYYIKRVLWEEFE